MENSDLQFVTDSILKIANEKVKKTPKELNVFFRDRNKIF